MEFAGHLIEMAAKCSLVEGVEPATVQSAYSKAVYCYQSHEAELQTEREKGY